MRQVIFHNWNFIRIVRLIVGVSILGQGILAKDVLLAIAGSLFATMAIFTAGCCATGSCNISPKKKLETTKEGTYEEVV
jgi:hypothetical protein